MAANFKVSIASRKLNANAAYDVLNGGFIDILDSTGGTGQPTSPDTAIGSQVVLAVCPLNATAFGAAANSGETVTKTANAITADASANATGTATWFRAYKSDHTTAVCDGTVGTASADLILDSVAIVATEPVSITSWVITIP